VGVWEHTDTDDLTQSPNRASPETNTNTQRILFVSRLLRSHWYPLVSNCLPAQLILGSPGTLVKVVENLIRLLFNNNINRGHSHNHLGNGIREWSGNRCMSAIPREFPFPFPVCVALFYYTDIGESLRSLGQFLTAVDLGWPDPHPPP